MKRRKTLFAVLFASMGCLTLTSCEEILYGLMMGMATYPSPYPMATMSTSTGSIPPPPSPMAVPVPPAPTPTVPSTYIPTYTPTYTPSYSAPSSTSSGSSGSSNPVQAHQETKDCPSCHGSGKCATCNGTHRMNYQFGSGTLECPNCKPNGACSSCGGSGKKTSTKYY